jgi:uncharacterized protein YutE (UPF0331/DUF86 family)
MSPSRIRESVVAAKAAIVRDMLTAIETLPLASRESFVADRRMVAAGESFLRRGLEALLDVGRHLLAKGFGVPAVEYKEIARTLGEQGVLGGDRAEDLSRMAGYRNRLVHFYDEVSADELYEILTRHRGAIEEVLAAIETWLADHPERVDTRL